MSFLHKDRKRLQSNGRAMDFDHFIEAQRLSGAKRIAISSFICLHLFTLGFIHTPAWLSSGLFQWATANLSPMTTWRLGYAGWVVRRYAHAVGLDNRWEMFSSVYRSERRFVILANYKDRTSKVLPLPLQGERSWLQSVFADFRESKFHLNLYRDRTALEAYLAWLAREFSNWRDKAADEITIEVEEQSFYATPEEAAAHGTHFSGPRRRAPFARVTCQPGGGRSDR